MEIIIPKNLKFLYEDMHTIPVMGELSRTRNKKVGLYDLEASKWHLEPTNSIARIAMCLEKFTTLSASEIEDEMKREREFEISNSHLFKSVPFKD